jgi:leader peptidase (prepilin peptidase) / N-methyltransferase
MYFLTHYLAPAVFGACIGSFLNVVILRLPAGRSIVLPNSRCAACGIPLPVRFNLPIVGWFLLRGWCHCGLARLSGRYPLVEALTAGCFVWIWNSHPPLHAAVYGLMACGLIVATFVDFDHYIIPDSISLGGCAAGLLLGTLFPQLHDTRGPLAGFLSSLAGLLLGGASLFAISVIGTLIFRKDAMGMGDVKLLAALGAFLGWLSIPFIISVASILGSIAGLLLLLGRRKRWGVRMAFGPFLALAGLLYPLGGKAWLLAYLSVFHSPP